MQGCRPLTEEVYSIEKVVEKGVVMELATTSRKYPKTFRPMDALGQDLAAQASPTAVRALASTLASPAQKYVGCR